MILYHLNILKIIVKYINDRNILVNACEYVIYIYHFVGMFAAAGKKKDVDQTQDVKKEADTTESKKQVSNVYLRQKNKIKIQIEKEKFLLYVKFILTHFVPR